MSVIRWDFDRIQDLANTLSSAISILETQKARLESLKELSNDAWTSDAGKEYSLRLSDDAQSINDVIQKYSDIRASLETAVSKYAQCSLDIHNKLLEVYNELSV